MSLRRREILAYSLLLVAAVCWVFGIALANDADKTDVLTGLGVRETAVATTETYVTTTVVTAPTEEISEYRQTSTVPEDNGFAGTNEDGEDIFFVEDRFVIVSTLALLIPAFSLVYSPHALSIVLLPVYIAPLPMYKNIHS